MEAATITTRAPELPADLLHWMYASAYAAIAKHRIGEDATYDVEEYRVCLSEFRRHNWRQLLTPDRAERVIVATEQLRVTLGLIAAQSQYPEHRQRTQFRDFPEVDELLRAHQVLLVPGTGDGPDRVPDHKPRGSSATRISPMATRSRNQQIREFYHEHSKNLSLTADTFKLTKGHICRIVRNVAQRKRND